MNPTTLIAIVGRKFIRFNTVNEFAKAGLSLFIMLGVFTTPINTINSTTTAIFLFIIVMFMVAFINIGLSYRKDESVMNMLLKFSLRRYLIAVVVSLSFSLFLTWAFVPEALVSVQTLIVSPFLLSFLFGMLFSATIDYYTVGGK